MVWARRILVGLAWLFVLGVAVQFLLAGIPLLGGGDSWEAHRGMGYGALTLLPVLILIAAFFAKPPRKVIGLAIALVIVTLVQPFWVTEFRDEFPGAFHVLGALVIAVLGHDVAQNATHLMKAGLA
jgi:hypothetical protein